MYGTRPEPVAYGKRISSTIEASYQANIEEFNRTKCSRKAALAARNFWLDIVDDIRERISQAGYQDNYLKALVTSLVLSDRILDNLES